MRSVMGRVQRSPHVVAYWRGGAFLIRNYATGTSTVANPLVCAVLHFCDEWKTLPQISRALHLKPAFVEKLVQRLVSRSLLETSSRSKDPRARAMGKLDAWNPEAGFFHTATKNVRFWSPKEAARRARARARRSPMPPPVKSYRGVPTISLPAPTDGGEFARVARQRRTWRRFSSAPVTFQELATVLGLTAGVQQWVRVGGRELPLKTSPSGGARHPIECYLVARDVKGLAPGLYHYAAGRHALARLRRGATAAQIRSYLPRSGYFARASALVLFTAMFERQLWRYSYSRAYRAALIEAGHVCQTFCLTATSLGLAPFSVMALADSLIEHDLGIDGITETVLYVAGVGRPPARSSWAPLARGTLRVRDNPRLRPR